MEHLLLRVAEAAEVLGIGKSSAYELIAAGQLPFVRVGKTIRIPAGELTVWIRKRVQNPVDTSDGRR